MTSVARPQPGFMSSYTLAFRIPKKSDIGGLVFWNPESEDDYDGPAKPAEFLAVGGTQRPVAAANRRAAEMLLERSRVSRDHRITPLGQALDEDCHYFAVELFAGFLAELG